MIDRPAVGRNLQDHLQVRLIYRCTKPITTNDALRSIGGRVGMAVEWLLRRSGPLAIGINQGGLFTRVLPESQTPDIQFHVATLSADMAGGKVHEFSGFTLSVCQLRPESTGSITLASADPFAAPKIHANYLATEADRHCTIAAIAFARRLCRNGAAVRLRRRGDPARPELYCGDATFSPSRESTASPFSIRSAPAGWVATTMQ